MFCYCSIFKFHSVFNRHTPRPHAARAAPQPYLFLKKASFCLVLGKSSVTHKRLNIQVSLDGMTGERSIR